jgi:hypothetical protein
LDRAPKRGFAGDANGVGLNAHLIQPQRAKMRHPFRLTGEVVSFSALQRVDDAVRQIGRAHVGEGRRVDRITRRPAHEVAQERQPRLARPRAKRREARRTKLRGEASLARVPGARIVDGDVGRSAQSRFEHRVVLGLKRLQRGAQQSHDLSLRDRHADSVQKRHDPRRQVI